MFETHNRCAPSPHLPATDLISPAFPQFTAHAWHPVCACESRIAELGTALDSALQIHTSSPPAASLSHAPSATHGTSALSDSAATDIAARLIDLVEVAETAVAALSHRLALASIAAASRAAGTVCADAFHAAAFPSLPSHCDQSIDRQQYEQHETQFNQQRRGYDGFVAPAGLRETLDSILAPIGGGCSQMPPPPPRLPVAAEQAFADGFNQQQYQTATHQSRQRDDSALSFRATDNGSLSSSAGVMSGMSDNPSGNRSAWTLVPASPTTLTALHSLVVSSPSSASCASTSHVVDDDATLSSGRRRSNRRNHDKSSDLHDGVSHVKTNLLASFGSSLSSSSSSSLSSSLSASSDSTRLGRTVARARELLTAHFLAADVACVQSHLRAFTFAPSTLSSSSSSSSFSSSSSSEPCDQFEHQQLEQHQHQRMAHWAVLALTMAPPRLWREFTRVRHRAIIAYLSESDSVASSSLSFSSLPMVAIRFAEFASILLFAARFDWPIICAHFSPFVPSLPSFEANLAAHFMSGSTMSSSPLPTFSSSFFAFISGDSLPQQQQKPLLQPHQDQSTSTTASSTNCGSQHSAAIACLLALYVEPVACAARRLLIGARNTNACVFVLETLVCALTPTCDWAAVMMIALFVIALLKMSSAMSA
jgi:hypothetical protein